MSNETVQRWEKDCKAFLVGKKIVAVRYLTAEEMNDLDWHSAALVIYFDDGSYIFPSMDDEGNNAGALFTSSETLPVIPVI